MKAFYQFHIVGYSEYRDGEYHEEGIVCAESYTDAVAQLEEAHEIMSIEYLEMMDEYLDKYMIQHIQWRYNKDEPTSDPMSDFGECDSCKLQVSRSLSKKFQKISKFVSENFRVFEI